MVSYTLNGVTSFYVIGPSNELLQEGSTLMAYDAEGSETWRTTGDGDLHARRRAGVCFDWAPLFQGEVRVATPLSGAPHETLRTGLVVQFVE
ncbi:MAG TPA: hypothetical protein VMS77_05500 [Conexivisphaerales archaeon]|nr:hypothetical protein [Conexivisphaerales archaeon]